MRSFLSVSFLFCPFRSFPCHFPVPFHALSYPCLSFCPCLSFPFRSVPPLSIPFHAGSRLVSSRNGTSRWILPQPIALFPGASRNITSRTVASRPVEKPRRASVLFRVGTRVHVCLGGCGGVLERRKFSRWNSRSFVKSQTAVHTRCHAHAHRTKGKRVP